MHLYFIKFNKAYPKTDINFKTHYTLAIYQICLQEGLKEKIYRRPGRGYKECAGDRKGQ